MKGSNRQVEMHKGAVAAGLRMVRWIWQSTEEAD